jgi:RNA polymerase sigma factor (sigma-70 family)
MIRFEGRRMDDDLELLSAWRNGDRGAGEALFERHFSAVSRFFQNKVGDQMADLVQQTFLACVDGRDRIRGEAGFRSYLFGVARNVLRRYIEARARAPVDLDSAIAHDLGPSITAMLRVQEEQRLLLEALRRLSLDHQIALELFYWERLTGPELAAVLGEPEGTVRTRLRRARQQLELRLAELAASEEILSSTTTDLDRWVQGLRDVVGRTADRG